MKSCKPAKDFSGEISFDYFLIVRKVSRETFTNASKIAKFVIFLFYLYDPSDMKQ